MASVWNAAKWARDLKRPLTRRRPRCDTRRANLPILSANSTPACRGHRGSRRAHPGNGAQSRRLEDPRIVTCRLAAGSHSRSGRTRNDPCSPRRRRPAARIARSQLPVFAVGRRLGQSLSPTMAKRTAATKKVAAESLIDYLFCPAICYLSGRSRH